MNCTRRTALTAALGTGLINFSSPVFAKKRSDDLKPEKITDVIVVGFGGAGATTAITAADAGAKVLVLERQPKATLRSNTRLSAGIFHCPGKDGNADALAEYATAMFAGPNGPTVSAGEHDDISAELGKGFAQYATGLVDFMKKCDPSFNPLPLPGWGASSLYPRGSETAYAMVRASYTKRVVSPSKSTYNLPKEQTCGGEAFWRCLETGVESRADKIEVAYEMRAIRLTQDTAGAVTGVIAVDSSGNEHYFRARRGVVLCSGGYEFHPGMRKAFLPGQGGEGWAFYGTPYNEGDGIAMGLSAGAGMHRASSVAGAVIMASPIRHNGLRIGMMTSTTSSGHSIIVNNFGRRYASEYKTQNGAGENSFHVLSSALNVDTLAYDASPSWLIFDETLRLQKPIVNLGSASVGYGFVDWGAKDNSTAIQKGWILKGDTIEELAQKIAETKDNAGRMRPETLRATVDAFNAACARGKDDEFGRSKETLTPVAKAPYYAVLLCSGGPNTKGGLAANGKKEVLDWNDKPIPRLYAVGEISCGLEQGGAMLTDLLVFGQIAGKEVANLKPLT